MSRLGAGPEFDLIRRIIAGAGQTHAQVRVGPGDDCAVIGNLAISMDASVEDVHFRRAWLSAEEIGWRAAASALSDLAAVGAEAVGILVSNVATSDDAGEFLEQLMRGAVAAADSVGAMLLGGDLARGERLVIDVVAVGTVAAPLLRSGARPGHEVWVTGRLGGAAAAVAAWETGGTPDARARERYAHPIPRIREALWLRERIGITSLIDLSDGLFGDVAHIAAASQCQVVIEPQAIPVDSAAGATLTQAGSGGEDYELCFTAAAGTVEPLVEEFGDLFGLPLTRVGMIEAGQGVLPGGEPGYQHFRKQSQ